MNRFWDWYDRTSTSKVRDRLTMCCFLWFFAGAPAIDYLLDHQVEWFRMSGLVLMMVVGVIRVFHLKRESDRELRETTERLDALRERLERL